MWCFAAALEVIFTTTSVSIICATWHFGQTKQKAGGSFKGMSHCRAGGINQLNILFFNMSDYNYMICSSKNKKNLPGCVVMHAKAHCKTGRSIIFLPVGVERYWRKVKESGVPVITTSKKIWEPVFWKTSK
jgi:hypothetical protein